MSMVSQKWYHAWLMHMSRPVLNFTIDSQEDIRKVDKIMDIYRDRKIRIKVFELHCYPIYDDSPEFFVLIDKWLCIAVQNGVEGLFFRVDGVSYPFPIWTILESKFLRWLFLWGCDLTPRVPQLSSGVVNCTSLRHLSLCHVSLDDNMFSALLKSCPLIDSFYLRGCVGLKKIDMSKLQNITSVSIWTISKHHILK
ncbi:hypothetical protein FXO38_01383 [Capsicum annuum]